MFAQKIRCLRGKSSLKHIDGWSYRAFGEVISVNPVVVDCGIIQVPDVFHSNDDRGVGEFVSFIIIRLDASQYATQAEHVSGGDKNGRLRPSHQTARFGELDEA